MNHLPVRLRITFPRSDHVTERELEPRTIAAIFEDCLEAYEQTFQIPKIKARQPKFRVHLLLDTELNQSRVLLTQERQLSRYITLDESESCYILRVEAVPYFEGLAGESEESCIAYDINMENENPGKVDSSLDMSKLSEELDMVKNARQPGSAADELESKDACASKKVTEMSICENSKVIKDDDFVEVVKPVPGSPSLKMTKTESSINKSESMPMIYDRCYLYDHRGFCYRNSCPFLHVCPNFTRFGTCRDPSCQSVHPCPYGSSCFELNGSKCKLLHSKSARPCKFSKAACLSDRCVMEHIDNHKSAHNNSNSYRGNRLKLCDYFNRKCGCLSQRTVGFLCEYAHICSNCGSVTHGAAFCDQVSIK